MLKKRKSNKELIDKWKYIKEKYIEFRKKIDSINKPFDYFFYTSFSETNPNFCPLFKINKVCHNIDAQEFNCMGCYCQHYDIEFIDCTNGLIGRCKIDSQDGKYSDDVWDCSNCIIPHISK